MKFLKYAHDGISVINSDTTLSRKTKNAKEYTITNKMIFYDKLEILSNNFFVFTESKGYMSSISYYLDMTMDKFKE